MERRLEIVIDPRKAETGADRVVTATNKVVDAGERVRNKFKAISGSFEDFSKQIKNASTGLSTRSFDAMMNALEANNKAMLQVQKTTEQLKKSTDALGKTTSTAAGRIDRASDSLKKYDGQTKTVVRTNKQATKGFLTFNQAVMGFALTVGSLQVGGLIADTGRMLDTFTEWENKLAVVTGGTVDLASATNDLVEVSIRSRTDMTATMDLYSKMIRVNQRYDFSQQQVLQITETVSQAIAMSGASVQGAQGAILQFAQALSGDFKASAQELNSIIEQTPGLAQAVAQAIGTTTDQLKRLAEDGLINTKDVLEGLLRIAPQIREQFERSNITIGQSIGGISDALTNLLGQNEKLNKGSKELAKSIQSLALNLKEYEDEIVSLSIALGAMATSVLPALLAAFVVMIGPIGQIILLFGTMAGAGAALGLKIRDMVDNIDEWNNQTERTVAETNKRKKAFNELATTLDKLTDRQLVKFEADWYTDNYDQILKLRGEVESFQKKYPNGITEAMIKGQSVASRQKVNLSFELEKYTSKVDLLNQLTKEQNAITAKSAALQDRLHKEFEEGIKVATGSGEAIDEATIALKAYIDEIKDPATAKAWKTYRQSIEKVIELGGDEEVQAEALKVAWGKLQKSLEDVGKSSTKTTKSVEKQKKSFEELLAVYDPAQRILNTYNKEVEEIEKNTDDLTDRVVLLAEAEAKRDEGLRKLKETQGEVKDNSEELTKAYEKEQKRLNDLAESYADTFMDGINAAMNGLDSFKDWFKNHLKEMALMALRNKIVLPITTAIAGGASGGSSAGGGGFSFENLMSGGLKDSALNLTSYFGGATSSGLGYSSSYGTFARSSFGQSLGLSGESTSLVTNTELLSKGMDQAIPSLTKFGEVVGEALGMVGAGLTAYSVSQKHGVVAGTAAGVGSLALGAGVNAAITAGSLSAGLSAGAAMLTNPVGWVIAGIGALLGGLNKPSDKLQTSSIDLASGKAFEGGFTGKKFSQENRDYVDTLAAQVTGLTKYLGATTGLTPEGGVDLLVGNRDGLRLQYQGELVLSTKDSEEYVEKVQDFVAELYNIPVEAYKDLAEDGETLLQTLLRLDQQVAAVEDGFRLAGFTFDYTKEQALTLSESVIEAAGGFDKFTAGLIAIGSEVINNTVGLQFLENVKGLANYFSELGYSLPTTNDQFMDIISALDITTEAGRETYGALVAIAPQMVNFANDLEILLKAVSDPLTNLSQTIREQMMGEKELYDFRKAQAEALAASITTMSDPTRIAETVTEIERLTSAAWSSLAENQQMGMGQEFIDFLENTAAIATNQLETLVTGAAGEGIQDAAVTQQQAAEMSTQASENMNMAANELSTASAALLQAARELSGLSASLPNLTGGSSGEVQFA